MFSTILCCLLLSVTMNATIAFALKHASEAAFARSPNLAAGLVSTVGFFWFLSHSLLITRVGEKLLGGRRNAAIAITVGLTFVQMFALMVYVIVQAFLQFRR